MTRTQLRAAAGLVLALLSGCAAPAPPARLVAVVPAGEPLIVGGTGATVTLANAADASADLAWSVAAPPWLTISPTGGVLPPGDAIALRLALTGAPTDGERATLRIVGRAAGRPLEPLELALQAALVDCSGSGAEAPTAPGLGFSVAGSQDRGGRIVLAYDRPEAASAVLSRHRLVPLRSGGGALPDLVTPADGRDVAALLAALRRDPEVRWAERDRPLRRLAEVTPAAGAGDPRLAEQWALTRFGVLEGWGVAGPAPATAAVVIAIIDGGVALGHPDLAARLLPGCDLYVGDADPSPGWSGDRHGSHVAGIAAAARGDGTGVAGVAGGPGVRLLPVKVFGDGGGSTSSYAVAAAIRWAVGAPVPGFTPTDTPARIVNLSLGAPPDQLPATDARVLREAVEEATRRGALVFAAAGNSGDQGIHAPAVFPGAVAVGAVDGTRSRSSFSAFDADPTQATVALMAPGGVLDPDADGNGNANGCRGVLSTVPGGYGCASGTSMATAFAGGAAALLWSRNPDWSAARVLARLRSSALLPAGSDPRAFGAGIVCLDRALGAASRCGDPPEGGGATLGELPTEVP